MIDHVNNVPSKPIESIVPPADEPIVESIAPTPVASVPVVQGAVRRSRSGDISTVQGFISIAAAYKFMETEIKTEINPEVKLFTKKPIKAEDLVQGPNRRFKLSTFRTVMLNMIEDLSKSRMQFQAEFDNCPPGPDRLKWGMLVSNCDKAMTKLISQRLGFKKRKKRTGRGKRKSKGPSEIYNI